MRAFVGLLLCLVCLPGGAAGSGAVVLTIDGPIGPATSAYVAGGIEAAAEQDAELVLLRIDTPGGLARSMRDIVQAILGAPLPVVGYVAPPGARAASAGTYILYATHIAAMAPATTLGAATPVRLGAAPTQAPEANPEEPVDSATAMRRKIVNDAVASIRALAERRGRNADWAEQAVRLGASLTAQAALEKGVIDLMAADTAELLQAIDGREVATAKGPHTLATAGLTLREREPDWRMRLLAVITNPTVAYLLMMIGIFGLILEAYSPGAVLPGVVGAICLLVALFAFQILPVNYAGLALLALGIALMVAEAFAPSFGVLGLGGVAAFVIGSIMLMDTDVPGYGLPLAVIAAIATAAALLMFLIIGLFAHARRKPVVTGREGLIDARAQALEGFTGRGHVLVHGERWEAVAARPVQAGQALRVVASDGLTVTVEPVADPANQAVSSSLSDLE